MRLRDFDSAVNIYEEEECMNKHCIIKGGNESIRDCIKKNSGLVIIYGATFGGDVLVDNSIFKIDYFCDKKAPAW